MAVALPLVSSFIDDPDMREILPDFIAQLPGKVGRIQRMVQEGNLLSLRDLVHQLKGAGGGYGFDSISERAAAIEGPLKSGAELESLRGQIQELIELLRSVSGYERSGEIIA